MAVVADIANFIREGKVAEARHALTTREEPLYGTIDGLVRQVVATEQTRMGTSAPAPSRPTDAPAS